MRRRERWRIDCVLWCKLWWLALQNMLARGQTTLNCCHPRPLHPCYHISQPITAFRSSTANYTFQQTASCLFLHLNGVMWIKSTVFLLSKSDVLNSFLRGFATSSFTRLSVLLHYCTSFLPIHFLLSFSALFHQKRVHVKCRAVVEDILLCSLTCDVQQRTKKLKQFQTLLALASYLSLWENW